MSQQSVKEALENTISAIRDNPAIANVVFRARTALEEDLRCRAEVRDFEPITIDEPPELGGENAGMNPVELVLAALGCCQEIMYSAYASVMGIPLHAVSVNLKGYLDLHGLLGMADVPPGYKNIRFETHIDSPAAPDQIKALVETVESHCPVLDTIVRSVQVSGQVFLNGAKLEPGGQPASA